MQNPTIVTVPCFSGAPWELDELAPLAHRSLRTMRLPAGEDDIEGYADFVSDQVSDLDGYVLLGDSFGAVVALALATRRPPGLQALVLSGGFAASPITSTFVKAKMAAARFLPGPLYRHVTLRFHAASLASPHDSDGQVPLAPSDVRELFVQNTSWRDYTARTRAAFSANYEDQLARIDVPTLVLSPSYDELIGADAASTLANGIPDAREVVLESTGHMFRFTHPHTYASAVEDFLATHVSADPDHPLGRARPTPTAGTTDMIRACRNAVAPGASAI